MKKTPRAKALKTTAVFLILLCLCWPVFGKTYVIKGEQTIWFEITNPDGVMFIPTYKSYSFTQEVVEDAPDRKVVKIHSLASQFNSSVEFPIPVGWLFENSTPYLVADKNIQKDDPKIKELAQKLTKDKKTEYEAVIAVVNWVGDNISYDKTLKLPEDALSVLKNRQAKCTGYSNFTLALLRGVGIPAREWIGYLPPQSKWTARKGEGVLHAWVEVFYPDAGWVLYDPQITHHFLDPYHILLQISGEGMNAIKAKWDSGEIETIFDTKYKILKNDDQTKIVDALPEPERDVYARQVWEQKFSVLLGVVKNEKGEIINKGAVYLWIGKEAKGHQLTPKGDFALYGLEPGTIKYSVTAPGYKERFQELTISKKDVYQATVVLEKGSSLRGFVKHRNGSPLSKGDVVIYDKKTELGNPYKINKDGSYLADSVNPGEYIVTVENTKLEELTRTEFTVKDGQNTLNLVVE